MCTKALAASNTRVQTILDSSHPGMTSRDPSHKTNDTMTICSIPLTLLGHQPILVSPPYQTVPMNKLHMEKHSLLPQPHSSADSVSSADAELKHIVSNMQKVKT